MPIAVMTSGQLQAMVAEALDGPFDQRRLDISHEILTQAILKEPDSFWLNFWLAGVKNRVGDIIGSTALLQRCLGLEGARVLEVWNNLGSIWRRVNVTEKAREAFFNAHEADGENPDVLNNMGTLFVNEGDPKTGEKYLREAIAIQPGHTHANWNLSLCLLEQQIWGEGFERYVWGLATGDRPSKPYIDCTGRPVKWWNGEKVKTLVIYGEQGVGDETMFLSMVPDILEFCDTLIIDVHPRLYNIAKRSFLHYGNVFVYDTRKSYGESPEWCKQYKIDAKAPLATCAKYLRYDESLFVPAKGGYLKPSSMLINEARSMIGASGPVVGISWVGGVTTTRKDLRSIRLEELLPIFKANPDVTWVNLQYTDTTEEVMAFQERHGITIHTFPEWVITDHNRWYSVSRDGNEIFRARDKEVAKQQTAGMTGITIEENRGPAFDLDRMFALIKVTDVIVTVNQSNVWFGGALGHPTMCLTPSRAAWRYGLERDDTAFFSSVRQYRQKHDGVWTQPIQELASDLARITKVEKCINYDTAI